LYTLLKLMLRSHVEEGVDNMKVERKINKLTAIIHKYLGGVEDISEDREHEMVSMSMQFVQESVAEIDGS
jgi:hypothetical protein